MHVVRHQVLVPFHLTLTHITKKLLCHGPTPVIGIKLLANLCEASWKAKGNASPQPTCAKWPSASHQPEHRNCAWGVNSFFTRGKRNIWKEGWLTRTSAVQKGTGKPLHYFPLGCHVEPQLQQGEWGAQQHKMC